LREFLRIFLRVVRENELPDHALLLKWRFDIVSPFVVILCLRTGLKAALTLTPFVVSLSNHERPKRNHSRYQSSLFESFFAGVAMPSLIDSRMPGIESK
jgi:hypothetical protein